jgi:two-component system sensor histidine kinase CpxA|tara:strand:+ start:872 stop:2239 length:1368 start_codon:yes stop_codon:yes gene_type:complete
MSLMIKGLLIFRSLYWKIFFFFWLTLIAVIFSVATLSEIIVEERDQDQYQRVVRLGIKAADIFETNGPAELTAWLRYIDQEFDVKGFMLDSKRRPISLANLPKNWLQFALPLTQNRLSERHLRGFQPYRISSSSNRIYTFVAHRDNRGPYPAWLKHLPILQVLTALVIVALLTAFVTWRITDPLRKLKQATDSFARGNLDTRLTNLVGARKDEIGEVGIAFNHMAERISLLVSNQQRLFRDISHELRTPLARQQIAIELLARKMPDTEHQSLHRIEREIERMNALIDQVLSLLRLEQQDQSPADETYDLGALLQKLTQDAQFEAQSKHQVLLQQPPHILLTGQPELVSRAVENILRNAIRYTSADGRVFLQVEKHKDNIVIRIEDEGEGVPDNSLKRLFEPFYRVETSRNQQSGGYGVGMAIADQAIRAQGGTIEASNRPTGGLRVDINLPNRSA